MHLSELISVCNAKERSELLTFWRPEGRREEPADDPSDELGGLMTDEAMVRRRLRFLSRKLVDLLRFFLGRRQFEASLEAVRKAQSCSLMSPHEVEAAVRALMKRGFLFPVRRTTSRPNRFVVPHELGEVLRGELEDLDLELADAFSLRRMLASTLVDTRVVEDSNSTERSPLQDLERSLLELTDRGSIDARRSQLPAEGVRPIFEAALEGGGGLLSRSVVSRNGMDADFSRRMVKEHLERERLGTVRHLALGEYGINHFDDMVIVFEEVLQAELETRRPQPEEHGQRIRSLGVDLLSDLAEFLNRLSREKVRLTQSGSVYRTAARKIEEELILGSKGDFEAASILQFLFDVSLSCHLIRRSSDRHLSLTAKGRTWPRLGVGFKLKELLHGVLDDPGVHFHRPRLQRLALDVLHELSAERWYDFFLVVGLIRHRYLATLDEAGIRDAYQSRYQYSSEAHMRDLGQLTQMVSEFLSRELNLLGLIDLTLEADRPAALRLSALAEKVLGAAKDTAEAAALGPRLLVNPDFEIVLFPEGDSYELIQNLDRFAERVSADGAYRYRITARSVERAVAGGLSVAEILETLSEHSDSELPQNVVYSVRDHASKVRFVRVQQALLLSARHKEVIDTVLRHSAVRRAVLERLSPRMLALNPATPLDQITPVLEQHGIFLEGDAGIADDDGPPNGVPESL